MAKVPAVHREARFSGIRVAVLTEKGVLPDTQFLAQARLRGFMHEIDD